MATILTFRKVELRRQSGDTAGAVSCEVIIFPGIRYERWSEVRDDDAQVVSVAKAPSVRQRRDVLELAE
jgi:ribosomal protein L5